MSPRTSGFTLAEMLVVLALLAIAFAVALPWAGSGGRLDDAQKPAQSIATGLRQARLQAVGTNREFVYQIDLKARTARGIEGSSPVVIPENVGIEALTSRGEHVADAIGFRFFPGGGATGGEIVLTSGKTRHRIQVNWLTGTVDELREQLP